MSKLSECVDILDSKRIPLSGKERESHKKIYPYYGAQGIIDYVEDYIFDGNYILVAEDGNNLKSLNENIAIWATGKFWVNNHAHILGERDGNNLKFIYYLLCTMDLRGFITGSAQPKLNQDNLSKLEMELPSIDIQNKAADSLSTLDNKIANNNKINATLEVMAKTLYDYWFLQFDFPDGNGKPYRASGGKMVWNEELKREIPEGWKVGNLYDIADYINGLACQKYRPIAGEESLPVVKIKEIHEGCSHETERVKQDIPNNNVIDTGDILFSWSATLEISYWYGGKAGLNQHIFKVVPHNGYYKEYVYQQLSAYIINFVQMAEARKTTMGHITSEHLKQSRIILPPCKLTDYYEEKIKAVRQKIKQCSVENQQLTSLRDFLLPMLMNGQVTFK